VAVFGLLLASFPARNPELLAHLAAGRALVRGALEGVSPTWLYDVVSYGLFQALGGAGLVAVKACLVAGLAFVLLRLSRTPPGSPLSLPEGEGGWLIPVACTMLAVLAVGSRALLAPATVSYLLLAVTATVAWRARVGSAWPGWKLVGLFALWGNTDRWFVLGLGVVALIQVGQWLDDRVWGSRGLLGRLGAVALLAAAAAVNPAHLTGFSLPAELGWQTAPAETLLLADSPAVASPFARGYLSILGNSPAALAYYPLLGLGLVSFLLALPRWRWQVCLPWVALAALSAFQARAVPFFAVVAGPVLAWNLQEFFARRLFLGSPKAKERARAPGLVVSWSPRLLVAVLATAFLVAAWPGWLQRPPFEPRRWAIELPVGLEQAAAVVSRGYVDGTWPPGTRTLHLSRDPAHAFAWFCPEDDGVLDHRLAAAVAGADDLSAAAAERLAAARIGRVVVQVADRGLPLAALPRLLADPDRWPLLYLEGGVVVFGHRDPNRIGHPDPFRGREVDLNRLAFRPAESEKAPPAPLAVQRRWWDAFWTPVPPPTGDRGEAAVLLLKAEVLRAAAPVRHLAAWEAGQAAALAAAAAGWDERGGAADAAVRLTVLRPPLPEPGAMPAPITRFTFDCQRQFALSRDDAPVGVLYAAVRAARRAVSANPADAGGHLLLGQCYLRLLMGTRERAWALRLPQLAQLRQAQASAALNRALTLHPGLAQAHLELGRLYQQIGYLDLALTHLQAYRNAARPRALPAPPSAEGEERPGGTAGGVGREAVADAELAELAGVVDRQRAEFAPESARARVADRARAAVERGLAGEARAILLESDVSAFGAEGTELELDLLLRTGRADDVRDWTAAESKGSLGTVRYHWLRTQALAALGEYAAADAELAELAGEEGPAGARTAQVFAVLTGRALLDEQPAGLGLPALVSRAWARFEFWSAVQREAAGLAGRADAALLRGLLTLEAGEMERARTALRAALAYSSPGSADGGLVGSVRPVAQDAMGLLQEGAARAP
jgi:hypothetical protein